MRSESEGSTGRKHRARLDVVDHEMAAALRSRLPADRLRTSYDLWRWAEASIRTRLESTHPEWSEEERSQEVARRMAHGSW